MIGEKLVVLFVDECDHVKRDSDTFMTFLIRRLPQRIRAKLILVFASNHLDWPSQLDPRVKSFLQLNELIFKPVTVTPDDLSELIKYYKDPIVKYNIEKELKRAKVGVEILKKLKKLV